MLLTASRFEPCTVQITSCASSIAQHAGVAALAAWPSAAAGTLKAHVADLRSKRDLTLELLRRIPGVTCPTPEGAFCRVAGPRTLRSRSRSLRDPRSRPVRATDVLPDVSAYFGKRAADGAVVDSAEALCMLALDTYKVAFVPGEAFGAPKTIRLSYAATRENITDAVDKLARCLGELK